MFLFSTTPTLAQATLKIGFQGGFNFTTPETTPISVSTSTHLGLLLGAISEIRLSETGSLQIGLSYIQKRVALNSLPSTWKVDYLEIPILLKASLLSAAVKPYFLCGPALGIGLQRKLEVTLANEVHEFDIEDSVEPNDFVIYVGGGAEYQVNATLDIFADARYAMGMMNVNKSGNGSWKNSGFQFVLGTKFAL